jgi:negative regulator of sigma-B (phosphoserine phosphatase)
MTSGCLEWGVASRPKHGEAQSGDSYVVTADASGVLVAVIDGLGHGLEASRAAARAVATLEAHIGETIMALTRRCHEALVGTRGVVMSLARFAPREQTVSWLGVGNVEGSLLRFGDSDSPHEPLLLRGGVVGQRLPALIASILPVAPHDTLIFATDGIAGAFTTRLESHQSAQVVAESILEAHGKDSDDALVLVARYLPTEGAS